MNRFLCLSLGLVLGASAVRAQTVEIPLPPPTPLNPDAATPSTGNTISPTAPIAQKKAADYSDAELRALGESVAFPYELLDVVLRRYSKDGEIYYLKAKGDNDLETFVRAVALADVSKFPVFSSPADPSDPSKGLVEDHNAELVFWVNAYNGLRLKAVADVYPVESIVSLKGFETDKKQTVAGQ